MVDLDVVPNASFDARLAQEDFAALAAFVHKVCGIHLPPAKSAMLEARLRRRLRALDLAGFDDYLDLLADPEARSNELPRLIEAVTTNKTEFFREPAQFEFMASDAIELLRTTGAGQVRPMRAWSSACSTGQEPYTLAMVLANVPRQKLPRGFEIIASDISEAVLQTARRGIYPASALDEVPEPYRSRFLLRPKNRSLDVVRVVPDLRRTVDVRNINLNSPTYGIDGKMDVIFCRNVLIYFDQAKKLEILRRLTHVLRLGGILCLGHADSTIAMDLPLQPILPSVYRRR